jgi:hypothetical protein
MGMVQHTSHGFDLLFVDDICNVKPHLCFNIRAHNGGLALFIIISRFYLVIPANDCANRSVCGADSGSPACVLAIPARFLRYKAILLIYCIFGLGYRHMRSQKWLIVIGVLGLVGEEWGNTCNCYTLACLDSFDLSRRSLGSAFNSLWMGWTACGGQEYLLL